MGAKKTFRDRLKKGFGILTEKVNDGGTRSRAVINLGRYLMGGILSNRREIQQVRSQVEQATQANQDAIQGASDSMEQATTSVSDQYRGLSLRFETVEHASREATKAANAMKDAHEVSEPIRKDVDHLKNGHSNLREDVDALKKEAETPAPSQEASEPTLDSVRIMLQDMADAALSGPLEELNALKDQVRETLTQLQDALARVSEHEEQAAAQPAQVVEAPVKVPEPEPVTSMEVPEPVEEAAQEARAPLAVVLPVPDVQVEDAEPVEVPEVEAAPDLQVSEDEQLTERADKLEAALKPVLIDAGFNLEDDEDENNVPLGEQVQGLREAVEALEIRVGSREEDDSQETGEDTRPIEVQLTELEQNFNAAKATWDEMNTNETSEGD